MNTKIKKTKSSWVDLVIDIMSMTIAGLLFYALMILFAVM